MVLRAGGEIEFHGDGGLPIGLLDEAEYSQWSLHLDPGDRLLFYSDGFTECADASGNMLEENGFARLIRRNGDLKADAFFEAMVWDLDMFHTGKDYADDLSCAMIEFRGPGQTRPK